MAWIVFWLVVGAIALTAMYLRYRTRQNTEATIRHGIDKGIIADAAAIATARALRTTPWSLLLIVFGMLHFFAAIGIAAFALLLQAHEPESVMPLLAIAAFTFFIAVGLLVAGVWLRRVLRRAND